MSDPMNAVPAPLDLVDPTGTVWTRKQPSPDRVALCLSADQIAGLAELERRRGSPHAAAVLDVVRDCLRTGRPPYALQLAPVTILDADGCDHLGRRWVLQRPEPAKLAWPLGGPELEHLAVGYNDAARDLHDRDEDGAARICAERAAEFRIVARAVDPSLVLSGRNDHLPAEGNA